MLDWLGNRRMRSTANYDPRGPHFISYRQSDGTELADELMWRLRAAGVPVWRDKSDLMPGHTDNRLKEVLKSGGLAGAVLIISPEVAQSRVVRKIEAPALLRLAQSSAFSLAIANAVPTTDGKPDYRAPDRLLGQRPGTLSNFMQHGVLAPGEMRKLVTAVLALRTERLASLVAKDGGTLHINVQTRNDGSVHDRSGAGLDIRVMPAARGRLPDPIGLNYFADSAGYLPTALLRSGAKTVHFSGGAHLSVALALGALIPATRLGRMEVLDGDGTIWASGPARVDAARAESLVAVAPRLVGGAGAGAVAAYVDLMSVQSNDAFECFLAEHAPRLSEAVHLTARTGESLDPEQASTMAAAVARHLRDLSNRNRNAQVHLLYRGPFALAPLIGRLLNTVTTVLYEWERLDEGGARYVPALRCVPSDQTTPIEVLLEGSDRSRAMPDGRSLSEDESTVRSGSSTTDGVHT